MPFNADELYVGMIAWFSVGELRRDERVRATGKPSFDAKPRPFVCYAGDDDDGCGGRSGHIGRDEWY